MPPARSRRWPKVLAVAAVLVVAVVLAGLLLLDRILLAQVRKQTDALSQRLGRPVAVESVKTKLLGGVGVRVAGVSVGAGEGEDRPLATLDRAEVEVNLLGALLSGGKRVTVREAVVDGLRVNVVRFPDGTTNLERAASRLEETSAKEPAAQAPKGEEKPADLSAVRVDRAAVENARIAFLDRSVKGAEELYVDDLDVEVRDLRAGQPLEVVLKAAVLAKAQNLELRVKAAPLPPTLVPTPEQLTLKVQPVDLGPLAPFVPGEAGFRGGRFQADLAVALGAAVPGGSGRTTVKGGFRADQLAFAGQEGGKKLDASLDADLDADAEKGDLRLGKLELTAGPVGLTGHGAATGLRGDAPRVEGLEIVSRGLDLAALTAYYPPLRKQLGDNVVAGPIGLSLKGSGGQAAQSLELRVDLGPVRLAIPRQLAKAAGAPMSLVARADLAQQGGVVRFDAAADLAGVDLRPGGSVAKKPGDPMSARAAGTYRRSGAEQQVELTRLDLDLLGDALAGKARVALAGSKEKPTTRFDAELSGQRLDLDRLLIPAPEGAEKPKEAEASKPVDPKAFAGLSGTASVRLGLLRMQQQDLRDIVLRVKVVEDAVTLEEARLVAFGGDVSAAGTAVKLAHPEEPFKIDVNMKGVEGERMLALFSKRKVLGGKLDAALQLTGKGTSLDPIKQSATGSLTGDLRDGAFFGKDLVAAVAAPIASKLPFAGGRVTEGGSTSLGKELGFAFQIANGVAKLTKPIKVQTGDNALSFDGGVRLDGTLQMPTTLELGPEVIAKITGGRAKMSAPIPVTFNLSGPAWSPRLDGLALDAAVQAIAKQAATSAAGKLLGDKAGAAGADLEQQKAAAEQKARDEAQKRKRQLEEDARKKLKGLFGR
jgi:AsmA protein